MSNALTGHCLCGAVKFRAEAKNRDVAACHCSICQRQVAGPYLAIECVPGTLRIEGQDQAAEYASSAWARRGFCKSCGSALYWRSNDGKFDLVSAGALDDTSQLALALEIFVDEKPSYYDFAKSGHRMTGAEFVAFVSGGQAGE